LHTKSVKHNNHQYRQKPKIQPDRSYRGPSKDVSKGLKTELTHDRKVYIRNNMDKPIEELKEETDLAEPIIRMVILADEQNLNKREDKYKQRKPKFDKLTQEMKDWLLEKAKQKKESGETWREINEEFSDKYSESEVTPVSRYSLTRWCKQMLTGKV